ncbi:S8 family serine peptidase [Bacteroidota bacterium]
MRKIITFCLILVFGFTLLHSNELNLPFLDKNSIGADEFIKKNPESDGRGVVIFILDSGVDPSVKGLTATSEGKVKVIDIQDFTGQVEIKLNLAGKENLEGNEVLSFDNFRLGGWDKLEIKPSDGKYYIGKLDENEYYKNSAVKDINSNGKTNDIFGILVFRIKNSGELPVDAPGHVKAKENEDLWVYFVDEDLDGNVDDENPMFDYKYRFDTFDFYKGEKDVKPLLTLSGNIDPSGPKLIINTSDNPHGTHCAGIAAGYQINGQAGLDGIAPGAYVVSLKIGNDILSGGATVTGSMKRAYEYGVKFLKDAGFKYGVYSMSYGIGSETPGRSDMEKYLDDFSKKHPEIVIVKSMGNSGPGINSVGNPSNVPGSITVGAMISPATLNDLYGSARKTNWITHFSSRGGCVSKPDVVAPGAAASTVPAYSKNDAFWGTSMSTPQAAGACALLFSAALNNDIAVDGFMVRKALKYTAKELPDYTSVDYGNGLVDLNKAFEYLKVLSNRKEYTKVLNYEISTENSFFNDMNGRAAYWNVGGFLPHAGEKQDVSISPVFPDDLSEKEKAEFYRVFSLRTSESWLDIDKSKIYIRGTQKASFGLIYDKEKLNKPGIYTARVFAYPENEESGGFADFDVQATVVVPYIFNNSNDYMLNFNNRKLNIGDIERIFVEVPPGASSMNIKLSPVNGKPYNMSIYAYSPDGNRVYYSGWASGIKDENEVFHYRIAEGDLKPGIWEIIPYSYYQSREVSYYNLNVKFYGINSIPDEINEIDYKAGEKPSFNIKIFNNYDEPEVITASGEIKGYSLNKEYSQENNISFRKKIKVSEDINKIDFEIKMPDAEYNKMTDLAVNVYNTSEKSILSTGMNRKYKTISFSPPGAGEYDFEIYPGFVSDEIKSKEWKLTVNEKYYYKEPIDIQPVTNNFVMYPQKWYDLKFSMENVYPISPVGFSTFGDVKFTNKDRDLLKQVVIEVK